MDSTSINDLPNEMLENIFIQMRGKDILNASRVCCRWQSVVHGLRENFWMRLCSDEYADFYEDSHRVSGLKWRELYKSFSLWENVADAEIRVTDVHSIGDKPGYEGRLNLLKNGVVSFPISTCSNNLNKKYNTVIYYDVKTRKEIKKVTYDLGFRNYIENDNIITFQIKDKGNFRIRVIPKVREDKFKDLIVARYMNVQILGNEIFYQVKSMGKTVKFCRVRVIITNENVEFESKVVDTDGWDDIMDVTYHDDKLFVSVFSNEGKNHWLIAELKNDYLQVILDVHHLEEIKQYGLCWTNTYNRDRDVFEWLTQLKMMDDDYVFHIDSKEIVCPLAYGPHLLTSTTQSKTEPGKLHIFLNPFNTTGRTTLSELEPTLSINIDDSISGNIERRTWIKGQYLDQIKIIEKVNGHVLLLVYCKRLVIIDINHEDYTGCTNEFNEELRPTKRKRYH